MQATGEKLEQKEIKVKPHLLKSKTLEYARAGSLRQVGHASSMYQHWEEGKFPLLFALFSVKKFWLSDVPEVN